MEMFRYAVRPAALSLCVFLATFVTGHAGAQDSDTQLTSAAATNHTVTQALERMQMLVKSSSILTLDSKIPRFQVHNEEVLGANPISQNQLQVFAKTPGTTQINLWDTDDKQYTVDITVIADAREIEGVLASQLPLASLKVMPISTSAIVAGYVTSVDDVDRAIAIVEQYYPTVVNNIRVIGVQQVVLHTRIMEVSRTKLRELGVDIGWTDGIKNIVSDPAGLVSGTNVFSGDEFTTLIQALRQQSMIKLLAEPTLVATHGRPARFNVGGEIPFLINNGQQGNTVEFQEFGTSIDFLPFVVGPGRIRLEVRPEVKEIDQSLGGTSGVPGFTARYVDTSVELQAGQTFAIAGLLQSRTESTIDATPLLGELPLFGALFRRVNHKRNEVELLITVTPDLVDAMDPHEVPRGGPGMNSDSPNDWELYMKGHMEVPNLNGGDGCSMESAPGMMEGPSMLQNSIMQHGAIMSHGEMGGSTANAQISPMGQYGTPVPSAQGTAMPMVGDNLMLPAPSGY